MTRCRTQRDVLEEAGRESSKVLKPFDDQRESLRGLAAQPMLRLGDLDRKLIPTDRPEDRLPQLIGAHVALAYDFFRFVR